MKNRPKSKIAINLVGLAEFWIRIYLKILYLQKKFLNNKKLYSYTEAHIAYSN